MTTEEVTKEQLFDARVAMKDAEVALQDAERRSSAARRAYTQASIRYEELLLIAEGQETLPLFTKETT